MWDEGRLEYGQDERQAIDLAIPPIGARAANGIAVLVHASPRGARMKEMEPLGVNLMAHGWAVANVDYAEPGDIPAGMGEARAWFREVGGAGPSIAVTAGDAAPAMAAGADQAEALVLVDPALGDVRLADIATPVCLVVERDAPTVEADGVETIEARDLSRGLGLDPLSDHWFAVASWIHRATGARSDPLGDKELGSARR